MRTLTLALLVGSCLVSPAAADVAMVRSADFQSTIGVVTHVAYTDGSYADLSAVQKGLQYLGVRSLRDAAPSNLQQKQRLAVMAQAGYSFSLMVNGDITSQLAASSALASTYRGSVAAIEGPNEVNNQPVSYGGVIGTAGAQAYQQALYSLAKVDPNLKAVPVLNFTDYPDTSGRADAGTFHSYPKGATDPDPTLWYDAGHQSAVMPGVPLWCTESGFYTMKGPDGVSEAAQATYLVETLAYNATRGVAHTYLYELVDEKADPSAVDSEKHYGLFRTDFTAKPAAVQLKNLISFTRDDGPAAIGFAPKPLSVAFSDSEVKHLIVANSDGSYVLLFWIEQSVWNSKSQTVVSTPPRRITFTLSGPHTATSLRLGDGSKKPIGRANHWDWDYVSGVIAVRIEAN